MRSVRLTVAVPVPVLVATAAAAACAIIAVLGIGVAARAADAPTAKPPAETPAPSPEAVAGAAGAASEPAVVRVENESVRVLEIRIPPGGKVGWHSHPARVVYVIEDYKMRFFSPDGTSKIKERKKGDIIWHEATTHAAENVNDKEFHTLVVEIKPRVAAAPTGGGDETLLVSAGAGADAAALLNAFAGPFGLALGRTAKVQPIEGDAPPKGTPIDGSSVLAVRESLHTAWHAGASELRHTDLEPICLLTSAPLALVVDANAPWRTLRELIEDAKKRPRAITYGGAPSSPSFLVPALFAHQAGVQLGVLATGGGDLSAVPIGALDATTRPLAVSGVKRHPKRPDVPTFQELGLDVVYAAHLGLMAPKGTPRASLERLEAACQRAADDRDLADQAEASGARVTYMPRAGYRTFLDELDARTARTLRAIGVHKR